MRTITIFALCFLLAGCVQNSYHRPYMISHEKVEEIKEEPVVPYDSESNKVSH